MFIYSSYQIIRKVLKSIISIKNIHNKFSITDLWILFFNSEMYFIIC